MVIARSPAACFAPRFARWAFVFIELIRTGKLRVNYGHVVVLRQVINRRIFMCPEHQINRRVSIRVH